MLNDLSNAPRKVAAVIEPPAATPKPSAPLRRLKPVPGHFLLGSTVDAWRDPLQLFARTAFGQDIVRYKFFYIDYFLVNEPSAIQHVLVSNAANYKKSRNYAGLKAVLGEGLLTSEGEHWRRQRKLSQPAFHRDKLRGFATTMARCTAQAMDRWEAEHLAQPFDLHEEMMRLTFRIVGLTLLSRDFDGDAKLAGEALNVVLVWANEYAQSVVRVPPWVPTARNRGFKKAKQQLDALVERVIDERRNSTQEFDDLLSMLMAAREEGTEARMSDEELRHELLTLVLAGHETTANALTFTLYLLSRHPEVRARVEAEVDAVLGGREATLDDLKDLDTVRCVAEEGLRLYPPAWIFEREALADDVVAGVHIPKGSIIGVSPYALHRREQPFHDATTFDPERMRKKAGAAPYGKYDYLPFGGGPRMCIGNAFAMMELTMLLAMTVARFRVDLAPGFELELDPATTLRPKHGVRVTLTPRSR